MPRGSRRTSYVRDTRGRFASTPGGGAPNRPPTKKASRGTNRLTRDNSGRIAGVGKNGATARGGRLRTGAGNLRARQIDRLKRAPLQGAVSRGGKARSAAAKKPAGWMQSPEARKDRVQQAADRKGYAKKLRALPKNARRAIQVERLARRQKGIVVAGITASQLTNIAEGRIRLIGNVGKRKGKLTPGQIGAMARTMSESARRLRVGMATGRRGRMRYNPNALQIATGTAARKIRGARVGGAGAIKGRPTGKAIAAASPGGRARMSKKQEGRMIATAERQMSATRAKDQEANRLYDALVKTGKIKPPKAASRIAKLTRAAQGDPNTERAKAAQRLLAKRAAKPAAPKRVTAGRVAGTVAKPRGMKPGAIKAKTKKTSQKALTPERIKSANANLKTRLTKVLDELRKVENAKNRDNSPMTSGSNFSPRYQKLIARGAKADRQLESLRRAAKKLKQIELGYTPEKYGFARGTAQRKALAAEIRKARGQLARLQREEVVAKKAYEESPVAKFGLWGEIGQNRRQSRKAKERGSARQTSLVDRYVGTSISIRKQLSAIQELRNKARQQTRETNKRQGSRRKP